MFLTFYIIVSTRFGVRSFRIAPQKGFILNGKEYPLRGVSRHQDWPGIGNALLPKHHKKDVELICEMGANTVRLAHYQHAQLFTICTTKKGLIVWAEIPYISRHMPKGTANTRQQMQELIYQNYNHPSIVVWGLSNEIKEVSSASLYDIVSIIQQNVFIFNASIRDNITMFHEFPKKEVDRAIELSGLSKLIAERGEDYLCGENGNGLSGGEKQRISIARSLLKKSQVLLVDEATAALDTATAYQVSNSILDLNDMTRIVVTHSLDAALLKRYDCIMALKGGRIEESGTFDELMNQKNYFYSLFTVSQ